MNSVQENVAKSREIGKFVQEIHSFRLVSMCFPTCSLVMCLWMTMPHVINLRQQFGGFLSVSKLLAGIVYMCVCIIVRMSLLPYGL